MIYHFPHKEYTYKRTPEFVAERFGRSNAWDPQMSIQARSPGEAIFKFQQYVVEGQANGAYEW
jgi:hypothetical protein